MKILNSIKKKIYKECQKVFNDLSNLLAEFLNDVVFQNAE